MKKSILLILCLVIISSCIQDETHPQSYWFIFYPRDCNYAWTGFDQLVSSTHNNINFEERQYFDGDSLSASKLIIYISTSNLNKSIYHDSLNIYGDTIINTVNEHNLQIETQIKASYIKANTYQSSGGMDVPPPLMMEYRMSEVKNLSISSNVTLFGQAAGSSLNSFLEIYSIDPACIFSAQDSLLMGFDQERAMNGMSIQEWLNMHPLAAALLYLHFKTVPPEVPVDAKIILKMELAGGTVLRDTSRVINILP